MNRARKKGTEAETAVVKYLQSYGLPAERRALHGSADRGDVAGVPGWVLEVKAAVSPEYGAWLAEAEAERVNAGERFGCVVHKPKGSGLTMPGGFRVVMTLDTFARLIKEEDD